MSPDKLQRLLVKVMEIERRYGHELRNARADRRSDVMEAINRFSAEELESDEATEAQA
jgi:hypothetical protein